MHIRLLFVKVILTLKQFWLLPTTLNSFDRHTLILIFLVGPLFNYLKLNEFVEARNIVTKEVVVVIVLLPVYW